MRFSFLNEPFCKTSVSLAPPRLKLILGVFDKEPGDEVFGQRAGAAEELLVERVVHGRHVGQSLLLVVPQERGRAAQTAHTGQKG